MRTLLKKDLKFYNEPVDLQIAAIRRDGGTQARAGLNEETVEDYMQAVDNQAHFPPVVVYHDGKDYWLADGFHRVEAYQRTGRMNISADMRQGTRRDAILHAAGANAAHGLRRTNADKRRAVETLLRDEEWSKWSDREIARMCAVSQPLVSQIRKTLTDNIISEKTYTTKHGTTTTMDTSNVGKKQAPEPEPEEERTQPPAPERQRIDSLPGEERTKLFEKLSRRRLRINGGSYNDGKRDYHFVRDIHTKGDMHERHTITYVDEAEALLTMVVPPAPPSQWARPVEEPEPPARVGSTGPVVDIGIAPGAKVKLKAVTGVFLKATQEQEGIRAWVKWPSGIVESIDPDILIVEKPEEPELPEQQPVAHPTIRQCMIDAYRLIKAGDKEGAHLQAQRFRAHPDIAGIIGHAIWGMQCAMEGDT
jgi:hypothetical protein